MEQAEKTFSFAGFELDTAKRLLLKDGQPLVLNPKAFDLLSVLVKNCGQILSKENLLETVWENQFVEENNLTVHISALRKIFGEKKGEHHFIVTIPGKGYKFVAEIWNGDGNSLAKADELLPKSDKLVVGEAIIGRAAEIAEIKSLFGNEAIGLITLTGAGGAGKTSLAKVAGNDLKADFADGVFFVELAAVRDTELVVPTIMQTLGASETANQNFAEVLKSFLRTRQILLILDNFEQITVAAPLVSELLDASAKLKILITSRVALHLENETEFPVKPLSIPPPNANLSPEKLSGYAAVELFVKRAKTVKPNFALSSENAKAITGICHKLDGLPLAVELAAARVKLLSPESIFTRLENSLNLLTGNAPDYFQRTMRETIGWSYDLLEPDEQNLFRQLAIFAGGFTIEAAESVVRHHLPVDDNEQRTIDNGKPTIEVLNLIESLIDNNLLTVREQWVGDARLQMLEVVREFALEMLEKTGEFSELQQIHAQYFLSLAEEAEPFLMSKMSNEWLAKLENEHDNFRAALAWSLKNNGETAARIAASLRYFWLNHSHLSEGLYWSKAALQVTETTISEARSKLLLSNGLFLKNFGEFDAAKKSYRKTLTESREINDLSQIIKANHGLAAIAVLEKDFAAAQIFQEESLALSLQLNDEMQTAFTLCALGDLEMSRGNPSSARPWLEECLVLSKKLGNKHLLTTTYFNLGIVDYQENEYDTAASNFAESLDIAREMDNKTLISCAFDGFAALAVKNGNAGQSAKLAGAAENLRESISYQLETGDEVFREKYLQTTRAALGEKAFAEIYEQGRAMNAEQSVALAEILISPHTEIIIETHKLERVVIEEEIVESEKTLKPVRQIIRSNEKTGDLIWLKNNLAAIIIAVLALAAIGGNFWLNGKSSNGVSFVSFTVKQLTTNGKVGLAALSPDGKLFAYTTDDLGQRSLWLGYVDGGNNLQLRPSAETVYSALAFAPDGKRLYFSSRDAQNPKTALYKIPVLGGVAEKVFDEISDFSLSPDGTQIAFSRDDSANKKEILMIADLNNGEKREIAAFPKSYFFSALDAETLSWSADGKRLAFAGVETDIFKSDLVTVEISSGKIERFKSDDWREISKTAWLADGNILITATTGAARWSSVPQFRIIHVELPRGKTREITTDRSSYSASLNLSAASDLLLSVEHRQLNNIWLAPVEDLSAARQITFSSFGKYDGLWGMDFTPDGKIIYTNSDTQSSFISQMNADGTEQKQLTAAGSVDSVLNVSNEGRYIVFHSNRGGGFDIWRMNIDGTNPLQLTFGHQNYQPFVSADNLWVYYKSRENGAGDLRRVSIDGGASEILSDKETSWLSFSPDGKYFAASYITDKQRLAIFSAQNNEVLKQFDIPKGGTLSMGSHWSPDSLAVVYRDYNFGYWKQSIEGGEAHRLEGLPKEKFYNFTFSKDGKWFAFVRGQEIRDVVLIENTK